MYICHLKNHLRQVFPQYLPIFSKVNGKASLEVLSHYPSPNAVLATGADALASLIQKVARKGADMAQKKADAGFLTAVTIVCEIGDFSTFRCPKKLYSYFGFDPVVRKSGNSAGADLRMSKRESPYVRHCFYMLVLQSVSLLKNGEPKNPFLRAYYLEKCKVKPNLQYCFRSIAGREAFRIGFPTGALSKVFVCVASDLISCFFKFSGPAEPLFPYTLFYPRFVCKLFSSPS